MPRKSLTSLSDLGKIKFPATPTPQPKPTPAKPKPQEQTYADAHEEFEALLGGRPKKAAAAPESSTAPQKPAEEPKPPTVRLRGAKGTRSLSAGNTAVLEAGDTTLVVESDGAKPVEVRLVVEMPKPEVVVREDTAAKDALARTERENARLAAEIERLKAETEALRAKAKRTIRIDAEELFPGEAYEHAVEALAEAAKAAEAVGGRRHELLAQIVKDNPQATELPRRRKVVDDVITSVRRPGPRELARLAEIDIREVSKNKHYKIGYGKHTFVLPLTPSDHRGGLNSAADINRKFF